MSPDGLRPNALLEAGPWPTEDGNARRTSTSTVSATASGAILWSAELDATVLGMSTSDDGRVLVATPDALITFTAGGEQRRDLPCQPAGQPTLLSDGRMVVAEHDGTTGRLSVRDQGTGRLLAAIPEWDLTPAVRADGLVLFPFEEAGRPSELRAFDLDGTFHWSAPLTSPDQSPPLLLDEWIVVTDARHLKAFDGRGQLAWVADRGGFRAAGSAPDAPDPSRRSDVERAALIDGDRIFVSYGAEGYFLFDPATRTVEQVPKGQWARSRCWALPFVDGRTELITNLGRHPAGRIVGKHLLDGRLVWRHTTVDDPVDVIADKDGKTVISLGITQQEWDKREWSAASRRQMLDLCYVRCLAPDGAELFTWRPEVRFRSPLAIGAGGEIYAAAGGRLWAIG